MREKKYKNDNASFHTRKKEQQTTSNKMQIIGKTIRIFMKTPKYSFAFFSRLEIWLKKKRNNVVLFWYRNIATQTCTDVTV